MKLLPRTIFGQIALAMFMVLLVVQLVSLWLLLDDRGRLNYKMLAEYSAQRMAGYASVLDVAEPAERPGLIKALSVQPTTLSMDFPWATDQRDESAGAEAFKAAAAQQLSRPLEIQMLSIERLDPMLLELHPPPPNLKREEGAHGRKHTERLNRDNYFARTYVAQVRLHDGAVVTFHHLLPVPAMDLSYRLVLLLALLGLATVVLSIWVVRRLTRPLARFALAAHGLAHNLNQAPIPENGPTEVEQAAQAFNSMQRGIKRLVDMRAQALSAVSHDLRLPITRMRLRLEGDIAPELREKMQKDLDEMDTMIGLTLDFLRAGSGSEPIVAVNLEALLDSLIEDMEEFGVAILREGHCKQPVNARPHALRRCLANLLDNARFYGGGEIQVVVRDDPKEVQVSITDNGPGIAPQNLEKVFDPYFRIESSRARHTGGTGLGLPIARAIAEAHGGTVTLVSDTGKGVTATLILPRQHKGVQGKMGVF